MNKENLKFIEREVMKYTGCYSLGQVLYSYNRLTVEELAQEVVLRVLRSSAEEYNKSYLRKAVMFTCIDQYRKISDYDEPEGDTLVAPDIEDYEDRLLSLKIFSPKELEIVLMLIEGRRNPEIREILGMPKMSYYSMLRRIKEKYMELQG